MRQLIAAIALAAASTASAEIYKCTGENGAIRYSGTPCAAGAEPVEVKAQAIGGTLGVSPEQKKLWASEPQRTPATRAAGATTNCRDFNSTELRRLIIQHQVVPGMRSGDVMRAWGSPERINGWQWVWGFRDFRSYVYISNGCVDSVDGVWGG